MGRYFTRQQIEEIRNQLAIRTVKDSDFPTTSKIEYDDFVAIVQNGVNKKININALFQELGVDFCSKYVLSLPIYTENGSNMLRKFDEADMVAKVMRGYDDVTANVPMRLFDWSRSSGDPSSDRAWNEQHQAYGPRVHITRSDINGSCTFFCCLPMEALEYIYNS